MTRRPNWTIVLTDSGFAAVPLGAVEEKAKRMRKHHAVALAEKMNADVITADVARRFGGEVAA
jgi:hypothetical protein